MNDTTETRADWRCEFCRGGDIHTATCVANTNAYRTGIPINAGTRVIFNNPQACFADLRNTVCTVETVTYGMGGMVSADTRARIAAGHAHLIMVTDDGRRIGTTSDRVTATRWAVPR